MGLVVAGDDEQAAGPLVEAVDDARALGVGAAAEDLAQLVDQGRAACARAPGGRPGRPACRRPRGRRRGGRRAAPAQPLSGSGLGSRRRMRTSRTTPTVIATSARLNGGQGDIDVVGDLAGADPVDQVAERAAGEQADRDPHPGPRRVAGEEVADDAQGRQRRPATRTTPPPPASPKATPRLWARVSSERAEHLDLLAGRRAGPRPPPWPPGRAIDDEPAEGAGQAPGAGGGAGHPAIRPTTIAPGDEEHDQADHRAEVEREAAAADRRQDAAEEVEVGVGGLGDEVEDRAQRRVVGHPRDPARSGC